MMAPGNTASRFPTTRRSFGASMATSPARAWSASATSRRAGSPRRFMPASPAAATAAHPESATHRERNLTMTTTYNVHIYREMRLVFGGIEADTHEAAASIARDKPTEHADDIADCDGDTFYACVDV